MESNETTPAAPVDLPTEVQVEPTTRCNLLCVACPRHEIVLQDMSFANFKNSLDQFPRLDTVVFLGLGETFMNQEIFEMLEYVADRGAISEVYTNGSFLNEKRRQRLAKIEPMVLYFSVDGDNAATHEELRPGSRFEKLKAIIKAMVEERNAAGTTRQAIGFSTVRNRVNVEQLPGIVRLGIKLGIDGIRCENLEPVWAEHKYRSDYSWISDQSLHMADDADKRRFKKLTLEAIWLARSHGIKMIIDSTMAPMRSNGGCDQPQRLIGIRASGDISVCCLLDALPPVGNVFEEPIATIWNSQHYCHLRGQIGDGEFPKECMGCGRTVG